MKYALILAGGLGTRMGKTDVPKQFLKIDDIPIIIYTIKQFSNITDINKIVVVIPEHYQEYLDRLLKKNNLRNVITVVGGKTRYESVLKGCIYINNNLKNDNDTAIISHDAVRPFVTKEIINDHINMIDYNKKLNAINTVLSIDDTIIRIKDGRVVDFPDRSTHFLSQTPQSFYLNEYIAICSTLTKEEIDKIKDVCAIYYLKQKIIGLTVGEASNFKITTQFDLELANNIIQKSKIKQLIK